MEGEGEAGQVAVVVAGAAWAVVSLTRLEQGPGEVEGEGVLHAGSVPALAVGLVEVLPHAGVTGAGSGKAGEDGT
jgi:hypothetical protein